MAAVEVGLFLIGNALLDEGVDGVVISGDVGRGFDGRLRGVDPPVGGRVVQAREDVVFGGILGPLVIGAEGAMAVHRAVDIDLFAIGRIVTDVAGPLGVADFGGREEVDEGAGGPGERALRGEHQVVLVHEAAEAFEGEGRVLAIAVLVAKGGNNDVLLGDRGALCEVLDLGIDDPGGVARGLGEGVEGFAIVSREVRVLDEAIDEEEGVFALLAISGVFVEVGRGEARAVGGVIEGRFQDVAVVIGGELDHPVHVDVLVGRVHGVDDHAVFEEVPDVVGLVAFRFVVHPGLEVELEGERVGVAVFVDASVFRPFFREVVHIAFFDALGLELIAILEKGAAVGGVAGFDFGVEEGVDLAVDGGLVVDLVFLDGGAGRFVKGFDEFALHFAATARGGEPVEGLGAKLSSRLLEEFGSGERFSFLDNFLNLGEFGRLLASARFTATREDRGRAQSQKAED